MRRSIAVLLAAAAAAGPLRADSLWSRRDPRFAEMFTDNRARRTGDLLTIVINENTQIQNREQNQLQKQTQNTFNFNFAASASSGGGGGGGGGGGNGPNATSQMATTSQRTLNGQAQYTSNRQITDRISVVVVSVLPNRNLVVEGYVTRAVGRETRLLHITGIVRPVDIRVDNTVDSEFVGNFQIRYAGRGPDTAYTNNGWLGRVLNVLWPF